MSYEDDIPYVEVKESKKKDIKVPQKTDCICSGSRHPSCPTHK